MQVNKGERLNLNPCKEAFKAYQDCLRGDATNVSRAKYQEKEAERKKAAGTWFTSIFKSDDDEEEEEEEEEDK